MSRTSNLLAYLFVAAAALPALAGSALAAPVGALAAPETRVVSYADLDLASPAGRAALDRRIHGAVREVCGTASSADLMGRQRVSLCRAETLAAANAQRPLLGEVLVAAAGR